MTTATQKLFLLNSPFMLQRAKSLAARLTSVPGESVSERIDKAYRLLYSRKASELEIRWAADFLEKPETGELSRWERYAQALLAANEMMYLD